MTREISADLERQGVSLKELHIGRAYLSSHLVRERSDELEVYCKAWPVRISKHFHKRAFVLDWEQQSIQCHAGQQMPFVPVRTDLACFFAQPSAPNGAALHPNFQPSRFLPPH